MNLIYDFIYYMVLNQKFEFYIFVMFSTIVIIFRTFNLIAPSITAQLYNLIYLVLGLNAFNSILAPHFNQNWIGSSFYNYEIGLIKFLVIVFWFILYYFIKTYFFDEYIEKNEFKMFSIDISFCGAIYIVTSNNMLEVFLGLEILAFPTYTLIGLEKNKESTEASLKYFIYSVYGSLLVILSFIVLFIASGQTSFNEFALYTDPFKAQLSAMLFATAFFIKLGVGPFYHWAPPVYQAVSAPVFIFISTVSKVPLLVAFIYLGQTSFLLPNTWSFFYLFVLLSIGSFMAARDLIGEKNIRRVMAYTSNINFTIGLLGLFFGLFNVKLFLSYAVLYLLSNLGVYIWHFCLNTDKNIRNEITIISQFKKEDKVSLFMLNLSLIINSGLPPLTLFIFKLLIIGSIGFWAAQTVNLLGLFVSVFILFCSLSSYAAYFNIMKNINYRKQNETPDMFEPAATTTKGYHFANFITVVSIYLFTCMLYFV
jgi:NADH-quinone oxidoreductase subunit N